MYIYRLLVFQLSCVFILAEEYGEIDVAVRHIFCKIDEFIFRYKNKLLKLRVAICALYIVTARDGDDYTSQKSHFDIHQFI